MQVRTRTGADEVILPFGIICAFVKRQKLKIDASRFIRKTICKIVLLKIRKAQLMTVARIHRLPDRVFGFRESRADFLRFQRDEAGKTASLLPVQNTACEMRRRCSYIYRSRCRARLINRNTEILKPADRFPPDRNFQSVIPNKAGVFTVSLFINGKPGIISKSCILI